MLEIIDCCAQLDAVVELTGNNAQNPVNDVKFHNLTFAHADWVCSKKQECDGQSAACMDTAISVSLILLYKGKKRAECDLFMQLTSRSTIASSHTWGLMRFGLWQARSELH